MIWLLVMVAGVAGGAWWWSRRRLYSLAAELPSALKSYPIIGHAYMFGGTSRDRMTALQKLGLETNKQGGLCSVWMGHKLFISITDPSAIAVVTETCLEKNDLLIKFTRTVIGNGSVFAPVKIWHPRRQTMAPFYSVKNLNRIVAVFDKKSALMTDLMRGEVGRGDFSIGNYIDTYTFDSIIETAVGVKLNSQENPKHTYIFCAMNGLTEMLAERIFQPWQHPDFVYKRLPVYKIFQRQRESATTFVDEVLLCSRWQPYSKLLDRELFGDENLAVSKHSYQISSKSPTFRGLTISNGLYDMPGSSHLEPNLKKEEVLCSIMLQKKRKELAARGQNDNNNNNKEFKSFVESTIESSGGMVNGYSDIELREEVMVMATAGTDTSAVGASFTAVLLSRHPAVQDKVYQELKEVFGESDRAVTMEDLSRLNYLEAVIKESLRLYPPVPLIVREVHDDVVLPSGTTLVDGTSIFINIWGTHRNPLYWGADADLFRPERFLQGALPHPAIFIPFSYSVRNCLGGTYAMRSVKTVLANLVRQYRLLPQAGARAADLTRPLPVTYSLIMKATDDFIVRIEERN